MGFRTTKKEELVWKIIRDSRSNYFLCEMSIPKGTRVYSQAYMKKIRVSKAKVNHITPISRAKVVYQYNLNLNIF